MAYEVKNNQASLASQQSVYKLSFFYSTEEGKFCNHDIPETESQNKKNDDLKQIWNLRLKVTYSVHT